MTNNKIREVIAFRLFERFSVEHRTVTAWQSAELKVRDDYRKLAEEMMKEWPEHSGLKISVQSTKKVEAALEEILMLPPQPAYKLPDNGTSN